MADVPGPPGGQRVGTSFGVELEREAQEEQTSQLYVREPAGDSRELAAGDLWP